MRGAMRVRKASPNLSDETSRGEPSVLQELVVLHIGIIHPKPVNVLLHHILNGGVASMVDVKGEGVRAFANRCWALVCVHVHAIVQLDPFSIHLDGAAMCPYSLRAICFSEM